MCVRCLNVLAQLNAIARAHEERRIQEEHGARIAARAEANRPWALSEQDEPTRKRTIAGWTGPFDNYTGLHE